MAAEPTARQWDADFAKASAALAQVCAQLHQWEQSGAVASQIRDIRVSISGVEPSLQRLRSQLDRLGDKSEFTRKTVTEKRDQIDKALADLAELQQRARSRRDNRPQNTGSFASSGSRDQASLPGSSFGRVGDAPASPATSLQPMSNREVMNRQQEQMKALDKPLISLEGTLDRLKVQAHGTQREIVDQTAMIDGLGNQTERVQDRLTMTSNALSRLPAETRNRCLWCLVIWLLVAVVAILILIL